MPKNIDVTDRNGLATIPAPTIIGVLQHKDVATNAVTILGTKGFIIEKEEYRMNLNKEVVQGVYHLSHANDTDNIGLILVWINSYDKTVGFRCDMGFYSKGTELENFIEFDTVMFRRNSTDLMKHTIEYMDERIQTGMQNYPKMVAFKQTLKDVHVSMGRIYELLGSLFFNEYLTSSQLIAIKNELKGSSTAGDLQQIISSTLNKCHPKSWFRQQTGVAALFKKEFVKTVAVDPAQMSIVDPEPPVIEIEETPQAIAGLEPEEVGELVDVIPHDEPSVFPSAPGDLPMSKSEVYAENNPVEQQGGGVQDEPVSEESIESTDPNPDPLSVTSIEGGPGETPVTPGEDPMLSPEIVQSLSDEREESKGSENLQSTERQDDLIVEEPKSMAEQLMETHGNVEVEEPVQVVQGTIFREEPVIEEGPIEAQRPSVYPEEVVPLEQQVAGETVSPVSAEELEASAPPVVEEPKVEAEPVQLVKDHKLQPNMDFDLDAKDNSNYSGLESPEFEF